MTPLKWNVTLERVAEYSEEYPKGAQKTVVMYGPSVPAIQQAVQRGWTAWKFISAGIHEDHANAFSLQREASQSDIEEGIKL